MLFYNCTIVTKSETPHLTWRVTLPGHMPLNFTYDSLSYMNISNYLGMNISVSLRAFRFQYIESEIVLTVVNDVDLNGTKLECSIDLDINTTTIYVNTSGMSKSLHKNILSVCL